METCPTCRFAWDAVTRSDVSPRILTVTHQFSQLIRDHADTASRRPLAATRTLGWVGAQALHECEHHYSDAQAQT